MLLSEVPELVPPANIDDRGDDERIVDDVVDFFAVEEDSVGGAAIAPISSISVAPASVILTHNILDEFAHVTVERATQIRHLVTNKLIIESDNADPRVRLRALELLGKVSDVGLFSERSEVVITHQSSLELEDKLRNKLRSLMDRAAIIDVEVIPEAPPTPAEQLGAELGLKG